MQFATHDTTSSSIDVLEAYERLILDAMRGDHTLFTTAAGIETLWEKSVPAAPDPPPVRAYAPGSWGPNAIHQLVAPHAWRLPFERSWRDPNAAGSRRSGVRLLRLRRGRGRLGRLGRRQRLGSRNVIRVPPDGERPASTVPACRSATWATIERPRPEPGIARDSDGAVEALEDVGQVGVVDAGALVVDGDDAAVQCDRDGAGRAGSTWRRCRAGWSARARARRSRPRRTRVRLDHERQRRRAAAHPGDRLLRAPRAARRCRPPAGVGSSRASSTRSPTRVVSSSSWARTSVEQLGPGVGRAADAPGLGEQVDVGAQRGERRAQLVAGVGDQPALPVPGGGERGEHLVERRRQPGDLVVALDAASAPAARCARSPRRRRSAGAPAAARCGPPPSRPRPAVMMPAMPNSRRHQPELGEQVSAAAPATARCTRA